MTDSPVTAPWARRLALGLVFIALAFLLGAWIFSRDNSPFPLDVWWNTLVAQWSSPALEAFSRAMNWLGGGWFGVIVVPLGGALALFLLRRPWAGAFFLTASAVSAALVQVLKQLFGRARPEDLAVLTDYGSFPSGHVANAATIAVATIVIFQRYWVLVAGIVWVLLMAFSRTHLHAHWVSDTLGGALAGSGAALAAAGAFGLLLARERVRRAARASALVVEDAAPQP